MAYQLRYYKDIDSAGHTWRLEIMQDIGADEGSVSPQEIGPVLQGLRLVLQGGQADIETPFIKTSLEMSFIDAPGIDYERKCGYWEEFYTSSATEYKVLLYKDGVLEWSGYLTPDSFEEDLRYRGSVSFIARDNLGTLQDVTFSMENVNADNKVTIGDLISKAIEISTCPMVYDSNVEQHPKGIADDIIREDGSLLLGQYIDIEDCKDKDWQEVLEDVLYAAGLVIRYVGRNVIKLMPLRDLPKYGKLYWSDIDIKDVQFMAYGRRAIVPAIKDIKEETKFKIEAEEISETVGPYNLEDTVDISVDCSILRGPTHTGANNALVPVYGYQQNRDIGYKSAGFSSLLAVEAFPKLEGEDSERYGQWDDPSIVYFPINRVVNVMPVSWKRPIHSTGTVNVSFKVGKAVTMLSDKSAVLNLPVQKFTGLFTQTIQYVIAHRDRLTHAFRYYSPASKSWNTNEIVNGTETASKIQIDNPSDVTIKVENITLPSEGEIWLIIKSINVESVGDGGFLTLRHDCTGIWYRIKEVHIDINIPEDVNMPDKVTLTTKYSEQYSVRLERDPEFAVNPSLAPEVAYVSNAICCEGEKQYYGIDQWAFNQGGLFPNTGISLSRLIHQQLLPFNAAPNNQLTGELMDANGKLPDFNSLWRWNGKYHMLTSGTLNILNGRMESAVLREFKRYDHMWETWVDKYPPMADIWSDEHLDTIEVPAHETSIQFIVYTADTAFINTQDTNYTSLPDWITFIGRSYYGAKSYRIYFRAAQNNGGAREGVIKLHTAFIKVKQVGIGDFGMDFNEDYS